MKHFLFILSLCFTLSAFGQSEYSKYIVADSLKKPVLIKNKDGGDTRISYLGVIKKANGDTMYYVFAVIRRVQAAIVMHGHADLIFLNRHRKEAKNYELGLAEDLPYKVVNNTLYFRYKDEKTNAKQVFKNKIGATLPQVMCVTPNNCY